jgi:DNA-binding LytR/AlgR family response regulator
MSTARPTALIAEDEPLLAQGLRAQLAQLWPQLQVLATVADGVSAVREALALQPDVLFFDIRMPGQSGLDAAAELAECWPAGGPQARAFPQLVFVTAYDQYAIAAFEAQAVDYLLKPVQDARLQKTIERLQQRLVRSSSGSPQAFEATLAQLRGLLEQGSALAPVAAPRLTVLQVGVGPAIEMLALQEVVYMEAADKYLRVLTAGREYLLRTPLKELLPQLDPEQFWQIHRGTVVQLAHIASIRRDASGRTTVLLRQRSETLAVSRLYAGRFRAM